MSMFMGAFPGQEVDPEKIKIAEVQFDAMNATFNNILKSCLEKCIAHDGYGEADLAKGEMCCIDRCVAKMHYSNRLIGGYAQAKGFGPETYLRHYENFKKEEK
ncbi:Tim12 protein [Maudiozyma humilis]|uniref:Mitochondrial import inner membrane translocase subunit n=1 Tax=Maudiozyma humilis TaxID=51915 RepID=A0AAV5S0S4_MAUHU|nr:Tim12 protein [Kazachstania humilis]